MKKIAQEIAALKERYTKALAEKPKGKTVSREEFTLLLSGISTCRRVPGIPEHMGYESLYHCESKKDARQVREHLERLFHVTDKDSLKRACVQVYHGSNEYEQFMTFWSDAPLFDINELTPDEGLRGFLHCKQLAENFHPIVREKGFYAWDIDNIIGLCRSAVACGILTDEEFWLATDPWVRKAQVFYHSYEEYAISSLCGAVYDMGRYDDDVSGFFDINRNLVENLLGEGGAWQRNAWYVPKEREWAVLLERNPGCFVTKRALDEGKMGYMYRDEPAPNYPDSGWRFFVGDESEEYVDNPDNTSVCGLNTVCNLWPDAMAYLHAEVGRRFGRQKDGWVEE